MIDQLCPIAFDRFDFRKVWSRVANETPDSISVHKLLDEEAQQSVMTVSGTHITIDTNSARLIYIGGATRDAVAKASRMLDNLFNKFVRDGVLKKKDIKILSAVFTLPLTCVAS
jgi:hypothetical protein